MSPTKRCNGGIPRARRTRTALPQPTATAESAGHRRPRVSSQHLRPFRVAGCCVVFGAATRRPEVRRAAVKATAPRQTIDGMRREPVRTGWGETSFGRCRRVGPWQASHLRGYVLWYRHVRRHIPRGPSNCTRRPLEPELELDAPPPRILRALPRDRRTRRPSANSRTSFRRTHASRAILRTHGTCARTRGVNAGRCTRMKGAYMCAGRATVCAGCVCVCTWSM
jgi:hypothetical protein